MAGELRHLGTWLWRLVPGNPILVRVVHGGGRRKQHFWLRLIYLAVLTFVMAVALLIIMPGAGNALDQMAKLSSQLFLVVSVVQLAMMCLLAPIFTAAAITQEKDAQTYGVLLTTPLSNAQIVLGSLLSRLFFVLVLLLAGLPVFCITMLYGGVTASEIFLSFALAGCTAVLTGALAIAMSVTKVGTRRTIFSFYLMIAVYLTAVFFLAMWAQTHVPEAPASTSALGRLSWLAAFHPFLALGAALNMTPPPPLADVAHYGWPAKYLAAYPHYAYIVLTLLVSGVLVVFSTFFVRRGAREGESTLWSRIRERFRPDDPALERRRKPRRVWANPVAWREAMTRASAGSRSVLRYLYIAGGTAAAIALLIYHVGQPGGTGTFFTRGWLSVILTVELVTVLLVGTNTAATAITRERESNTMDLLLCTPLTSRYIIWGKLRGLVSFTIPLIAVPIGTVLLLAMYDWITAVSPPAVYPEAVLELALLFVVYSGMACMIGLHSSLRFRKSVHAVVASIGAVGLLCLILSGCGASVLGGMDVYGALIAPLSPFIGIAAIVEPTSVLEITSWPVGRGQIRSLNLVGSILTTVAYLAIVAGLYGSMVRNFDMTVRKQSA